VSERFGPIEFDRFHTVDLPERLAAGNGKLAAAHLGGLRPIAFRLDDGRAYTYTPAADAIEITPGDEDASTIIELAHQDWCDFVWELKSCFALLYAERITVPRGSFGQLSRWEPALRAAFDGQAVYDFANPPPVLDDDGTPLDLSRSFTLDDSDDEIRDFLERAGFVHLRGVFDDDEVEALRAEVEAAVAQARPDDQRSWWTTVEGEEVCNRVNYLNDQSTLIAGLDDDHRLRRLGDLGGPDLRAAADRLDGHGVVIKVPGASSGLADLPWHRDCGMGGHPVKCPLLNVGIQLDAANPAAGQLQMIAGSHRGTSRLPASAEVEGLPVVSLTTEPGDVTAHWGHTLHAAPPPADRHAAGRRALYVTYVSPLTFEMVGPGQGYNDVLFTRDAGRVRHVDELR
jgi:ectoine hydroxylase-related dioxygenase (phytanoyl-CoA dioxygenase family)